MGINMKKYKHILILFSSILLISNSTFIAQNKLNENQVKDALTNIFNLSKNNNYSQIAKKLLYEKGDVLRTYNSDNNNELKAVKRTSKKIKAYLNLSDSYAYESISYNNYKNLPSAEINVNFKSGDQELTISFLFVEKSGSILLADFK
jgi:hypothetical protein